MEFKSLLHNISIIFHGKFHYFILSLFFFSADAERDVFNEKPSKEDIVAATQVNPSNSSFFENLPSP